jgi:EAL domain-containing protein (putative c-di-GMP-specific phosphodiesterase class I)
LADCPIVSSQGATIAAARVDVRSVVAEGRIKSVYQPIVDLADGSVVGYEALARGPAGTPLERPRTLFQDAADMGLVGELDRLCRERAIEGALAGGLVPPLSLFINLEPVTLRREDPLLTHLPEIGAGRIRVIAEFTERDIATRPAEAVAAVQWLRRRGCGIALDDVGTDPRSLALLPFLSPDVVKLDMSLLHEPRASRETAHIVMAVGAEAERRGTAVLAEGIETEEHLQRAYAMGATLGQGWLFGHPEDLPGKIPQPRPAAIPFRAKFSPNDKTPFECVAGERELRRGDKRLLMAMSRQLEAEAETLGQETVVLSSFQDVRYFSEATRDRYMRLGRSAALVGALGMGMPPEPAESVRGADLDRTDPLRGEWNVIVISPSFAGAFVARDLGDTGPDDERRFDFYVTYDRTLVRAAALPLLARILPQQA